MSIGRNEPCPCGSGKKYKNCCLNKSKVTTYTLGGYDISLIDIKDNDEFFENKRGGKIYYDESKQPILIIDKECYIKVLSVGYNKNYTPILTIQDKDGVLAVKTPQLLVDWCKQCVIDAQLGNNLFPAIVKFEVNNNIIIPTIIKY